ncbi:hypothetical protein K440DRAFT_682559 [Wilcoxina mikolae CBS 423.85]|nr:hypothetical protein K440DRAFT_682559 [Wilcoxina mikolae CBS 423.85]
MLPILSLPFLAFITTLAHAAVLKPPPTKTSNDGITIGKPIVMGPGPGTIQSGPPPVPSAAETSCAPTAPGYFHPSLFPPAYISDGMFFYSALQPHCWDDLWMNYYIQVLPPFPHLPGKVGDIVMTVNPPHTTPVQGKILSILISASFGLFGINKEYLSALEDKIIFIGFSALAGGSAQVANYLFTEGDGKNNYEQESTQIADVQAKVSDMCKALQDSVAKIVVDTQADVNKWLKLVSAGGFSQRITSSLPGETNNILEQVNVYILSLALNANNIVISASPNTNILQVAANSQGVVSCPSLDSFNSCHNWWYDTATDTTYTLTSMTSAGKRESYATLTQKMWSSGWVTPETFYKGEQCGGDPYLDDNMGVHCVSSVHKCTAANNVFNPRGHSTKEFTDCPDADFWMDDNLFGAGVDASIDGGWVWEGLHL